MSDESDIDDEPRGRISAFGYFMQTCREEHIKKHPDDVIIFAEFSRKCAGRWKTMSEEEKQPFNEMAEKDKQRYDMQIELWTRSYIDCAKSNNTGQEL